MENKKCQIVSSPGVARHLIQKGMKLVDIKPNKFDDKSTVFVFENSEEFRAIYEKEIKKQEDK